MPLPSVCLSCQVLRKIQLVIQDTAVSGDVFCEGSLGCHDEGIMSFEVGSAAGLCLLLPVTEKEHQKG